MSSYTREQETRCDVETLDRLAAATWALRQEQIRELLAALPKEQHDRFARAWLRTLCVWRGPVPTPTFCGLTYLGPSGAAEHVGLALSTWRLYMSLGRAPAPDIAFPSTGGGERRWWTPATLDAWSAARAGGAL